MDEILRKHVAAFKAALAGQAVECSPEKPINYGCQVVCRRGPEEIKVNFYHPTLLKSLNHDKIILNKYQTSC